MRTTAICPKCGAVQKGLNLQETKGSIVCNKCDAKFEVEVEEPAEEPASDITKTLSAHK